MTHDTSHEALLAWCEWEAKGWRDAAHDLRQHIADKRVAESHAASKIAQAEKWEALAAILRAHMAQPEIEECARCGHHMHPECRCCENAHWTPMPSAPPTRAQVEALRLDHAPSTYREEGWEDALNVVLALYPPAESPAPQETK